MRAGIGRSATDHTSIFALFGQDWTPFGSSTLPNLLESTGLGLGFGTLYERDPQIRMGVNHKFEGAFAIQPEIAPVELHAFHGVQRALHFDFAIRDQGWQILPEPL